MHVAKKRRKKKQQRQAPPRLVSSTGARPAKARRPVPKAAASSTSSSSSSSSWSGKSGKAEAPRATPKNTQFASTADSLRVVGEYHTNNKRLQQLLSERDSGGGGVAADRDREMADLRRKLDLDRYQKASMFGAGAGAFVCAEWAEPALRKYLSPSRWVLPGGKGKGKGKGNGGSSDGDAVSGPQRATILDVGAIDDQYRRFNWFDCVAIDLNPQGPSVVKADFFEYAEKRCLAFAGTKRPRGTSPPSSSSSSSSSSPVVPFAAIVMSLVINFTGDPRRRGEVCDIWPCP